MRQRRWIELFIDYKCEIRYHPRKANVVADALSEVSKVENVTAEMLRGMDQLIERKEDRVMKFIWVSLIDDVRTLIMDEAHASRVEVGDKVMMKVSSWKDVMHFEKKEMLAPRYSCYVAICTLVWASEVVSSGFPIVKVRRDSKRGPKFTWEREDHMKAKYSRLFVDDDVEPTS
ncbi:hypothetical protein Tco_0841560 [Tanacetum coccineum]|uniref:Reverse transcriptase domain-containing protein n=1 Tax=Tanacetum coccineum TaxID=301880 RepID=A0ABQ5B0L4_9ASTR